MTEFLLSLLEAKEPSHWSSRTADRLQNRCRHCRGLPVVKVLDVKMVARLWCGFSTHLRPGGDSESI
jgi:hypothetical protein